MKNKRLKQLLSFELLFMVLLGAIHYLIAQYLLPEIYQDFRVVYFYIFLLSLSFVGTIAIFYIHKNDDELIGKGFLVYTVLKILGSFLCLLPFLLDKDASTKPLVFQFFAVFFPTLLVETLIFLKMINFIESQKTQLDENQ